MFFFPLRDDNPTTRKTWVTWLIIALCCVGFLWQMSLGADGQTAIRALGVTPATLVGGAQLPPELHTVPVWMTVFTSMFMHGGILHLAGNMLYLWIFGDNIEDCVGSKWRYISLYALCGIAAAFAQSLVDPNSVVPMIGASGAIAGMLGAYLILHPRANIVCVIWIFIFFRVVNIPAFLVLGGWIGLQFLNLGQVASNVAYVAHIGGFVAGMMLIPLFRAKGVVLFEKPHSRAFAVAPIKSSSLHVPEMPRRPETRPDASRQADSGTDRHPWS